MSTQQGPDLNNLLLPQAWQLVNYLSSSFTGLQEEIVPSVVIGIKTPSITLGGKVILNVVSSSNTFLPTSYQWQFNGNPISGAINNSLVISPFENSNVGKYNLIVSNKFGSNTSNTEILSLTAAAALTPTIASPTQPLTQPLIP